MRPLSITGAGYRSTLRVALLVAALSTYLVSPDDVVWRFVKAAPHARLLEHVAFGTAAAMLGAALLLKMQASVRARRQGMQRPSRARAATADLLQAVGIGSLLPLPGFLLLVVGELCVSLLLYRKRPAAEEPSAGLELGPNLRAPRWGDALVEHIGLGCAFGSMLIFSIVLIDRVADALFAMTALCSAAAGTREALRARARPLPAP